jgi:hypothetical protein
MEEIKPNTRCNDNESFDPFSIDRDENGNKVKPGITPRCICGFELIKESEDTWRCVGGSHRYRISEGECSFDKFGNLLLKIPKDSNNTKGGKNKND